jgi:HSP20 family molecular chaperone IbpA
MQPYHFSDGSIRFICLERSYGNFTLNVPINWQIESDHVSAQLREGLLQIHLPKTKNCGREITVSITE